jgi:SOS-response transcriptional repressor LexA
VTDPETRFRPILDSRHEGLTARQKEIFTWIFETTLTNGYQPSYAEMVAHFGYATTNSIAVHIIALIRKGYLAIPPGMGHRGGGRNPRGLRFLRLPDGAPFRGLQPVLAPDPEPGESAPCSSPPAS